MTVLSFPELSHPRALEEGGMATKIEWTEGLNEFYVKRLVNDCKEALMEPNMERQCCKKKERVEVSL